MGKQNVMKQMLALTNNEVKKKNYFYKNNHFVIFLSFHPGFDERNLKNAHFLISLYHITVGKVHMSWIYIHGKKKEYPPFSLAPAYFFKQT